jgi:hypothetical protein
MTGLRFSEGQFNSLRILRLPVSRQVQEVNRIKTTEDTELHREMFSRQVSK